MTDNYLLQLTIAFVPALMYLATIYLRTNRLIDLQKALAFFFFGFCSILVVLGTHMIFPEILEYISYDVIPQPKSFNPYWFFNQSTPTAIAYIVHDFVQVALTEELAKFSMFFVGLWLLKKKARPNTLFSYMFYACVVGASFGMIENFVYFYNYSSSLTEEDLVSLMFSRSAYSVVLHMIVGMITGYFYALSTVVTDWKNKIGLVMSGILASTIIHGFFNYQLNHFPRYEFTGIDLVTLGIIASSLYLCYAMANDLAKRDGESDQLISFKGVMKLIFK
jgi:RsiW-degrading membrane proteinase PrsW (M82 family)